MAADEIDVTAFLVAYKRLSQLLKLIIPFIFRGGGGNVPEVPVSVQAPSHTEPREQFTSGCTSCKTRTLRTISTRWTLSLRYACPLTVCWNIFHGPSLSGITVFSSSNTCQLACQDRVGYWGGEGGGG